MNTKIYISPSKLYKFSYELGLKIIYDKYNPTWIIGLWRGGCPIAITIQGLLKHYNINTNHISIKTSSYKQYAKRKNNVKLYGYEYVINNLKSNDRILIVDDIFDTGKTIETVINLFKHHNPNIDIKIATLFYKPNNNITQFVPDYFYNITHNYIFFPHEFEDLTKDEIKQYMNIDLPKIT